MLQGVAGAIEGAIALVVAHVLGTNVLLICAKAACEEATILELIPGGHNASGNWAFRMCQIKGGGTHFQQFALE